MFWANDVGGTSRCPRCRSKLESENQIFMMAIRDADDIHPFIVGNDAGYFCSRCSTVVLDGEKFAEFARVSHGRETHTEFAVLGLVDMDAVPEDKRSIPLGGDDNPTPLVEFAKSSQATMKRRSEAGRRKKERRLKRKKRR